MIVVDKFQLYKNYYYMLKNIINNKNVKTFFRQRAKLHDVKNPLKTVIYQDKKPHLAIQRDIYEKKKIKKLINIDKEDSVLDIGCGIGRWANEMPNKIKKYVGVDNSIEFIKIAKKNIQKKKNKFFICLEGSNLLSPQIKSHSPFTIILIMGLFPYIDNNSCYKILNKILKINTLNTKIIIREPIAIKKELVLDNVWSDDMETFYSAKYRTHNWFNQIFKETLLKNGYKIVKDEHLYPKYLNNRKETRQHLFYLKR